jgi:hypothetical protein
MSDSNEPSGSGQHADSQEIALADELGMGDLLDPIFSGRGRLFSTAGRETPIAEFTDEYLVLYPPQKPLDEQTFAHDIVIGVSQEGILLNELGEPRKISGARFHGRELFCLAERNTVSGKHPVAWFDEHRKAHKLYWEGQELSIHAIYRLRNRTHDGELSIYQDLSTDV